MSITKMTIESNTVQVCLLFLNFFLFTNGFTSDTFIANPRKYEVAQYMNRGDCESSSKRRVLIETTLATVFSLVTAPTDASAGLLDEYGTDTTTEKKTPKLVGQKEAVSIKKEESVIAPNLRSNYYYPTNKKRYLPRIKKCNDAITGAADNIGSEDWEAVNDFAVKIADDTILPMKLYTSSLSGGGTNVKVSYTKTMMDDSKKFEKYQLALMKAIKKKDKQASSTALEGMAIALTDYRNVAGLTGPDGGGDIPSVDEIRRSACRVQGRTFEQKVKQRDARLAVEASTTVSPKK